LEATCTTKSRKLITGRIKANAAKKKLELCLSHVKVLLNDKQTHESTVLGDATRGAKHCAETALRYINEWISSTPSQEGDWILKYEQASAHQDELIYKYRTDLRKTDDELKRVLRELYSSNRDEQGQDVHAHAEITELRSNLQQMADERKQLRAENEVLKMDADYVARKSDDRISRIQNERAQERREYREAINTLSEEVAALRKEHGVEWGSALSLSEKIRSLEDTVTHLRSENDTLKKTEHCWRSQEEKLHSRALRINDLLISINSKDAHIAKITRETGEVVRMHKDQISALAMTILKLRNAIISFGVEDPLSQSELNRIVSLYR
jgi:chromosome segregation ATPase